MSIFYSKAARERHPELFERDEHIDRRTCTRVVPMRVLALGFARTGTASMRVGLEKLGFPTYHAHRIISSVEDISMWNEAFDSKYYGGSTTLDRKFWDQLLGHVSAITDFPTIAFAEELIAAYPEAKVVLWERDEDSWYPSFEESTIEAFAGNTMSFFGKLDWEWLGRGWDMFVHGLFGGTFRAKNADELRANARPVYREHFRKIREIMKNQPERFLEYKMGDGWEPICQLIGEPVPKEPFPRVNDRAAHAEMLNIMLVITAERSLWRISKILLPLLLALLAFRYLKSAG